MSGNPAACPIAFPVSANEERNGGWGLGTELTDINHLVRPIIYQTGSHGTLTILRGHFLLRGASQGQNCRRTDRHI